VSGAGRLRKEARQAQKAAQKRAEAGGPHGRALAALIARQAFIALSIGWGILIVLTLVVVLFGGDFGSAITKMCLVIGTLVVAVGLFAMPGANVRGSRFGGRVLSGAAGKLPSFRIGSEGGAPPMGYGLTFTTQCLVVGVPMLLIPAVFSK
jgi:hypothetical protein